MILKHEVSSIMRDDRVNPFERVVAIGGKSPDGSYWYLSQKNAIEAIKSGAHRFYVKDAGRRVEIVIARNSLYCEFLKSETDGDLPLRLLDLPQRSPAG